jgi:hypothetical protein
VLESLVAPTPIIKQKIVSSFPFFLTNPAQFWYIVSDLFVIFNETDNRNVLDKNYKDWGIYVIKKNKINKTSGESFERNHLSGAIS